MRPPSPLPNDFPYFPLPFSSPAWDRLSILLAQPLNSLNALQATLCNLHCLFHNELTTGKVVIPALDSNPPTWPDFQGLQAAIQIIEGREGVDFIGRVLPNIQAWALEAPEVFATPAQGDSGTNFIDDGIPVLLQDTEAKVRLTRRQIRCLLAHMLFGSFGYLPECGDVSHFSLYLTQYNPVGPARLACLLNVFVFHTKYPEWISSVQGLELVEFDRVVCTSPPDWSSLDIQLCRVVVSSTLVEDVHAGAPIVDFANKDLHIHRVIPSATQEEVLFSIFPEAFVGILICPRMLGHEAIIIRNAVRFTNYQGYADSFRYHSAAYPQQQQQPVQLDPRTIIAIDAVVNAGTKEWQPASLSRDLTKAFVGFERSLDDPNARCISTGLWGCGVFGGDPILKFLQQWMAASAAGATEMHFCVLDERTAKDVKAISEKLAGANVVRASLLVDQFAQLRLQRQVGNTVADWLRLFES